MDSHLSDDEGSGEDTYGVQSSESGESPPGSSSAKWMRDIGTAMWLGGGACFCFLGYFGITAEGMTAMEALLQKNSEGDQPMVIFLTGSVVGFALRLEGHRRLGKIHERGV